MTIIIIASSYDLHADAVVDNISKSALVYRVSPDEKPNFLSTVFEAKSFYINDNEIAFDDVSGIYARYAIESGVQAEIEDPVMRFSKNEWLETLCGTFLNVPAKKWINYPWFESRAEGKIFPLNMASGFGIRVPRFLVTNNIKHLDMFLNVEPDSGYVIKSISGAQLAFQNEKFVRLPDYGEFDAPFTKKFQRDLISEEIIDETPFLVQKEIIKKSEVRCVVIDDVVIATECEVDNLLSLDVRLKPNRIERSVELSLDLKEKIILFIKHMNLRFCTLDFSIDEAKNYWLTDINPAGNWLWQEKQLDLGIPQMLAEALLANK